MNDYSFIETCSLCDGGLTLVLPLAPTPPANEILSTHNADKEIFPLNLMKCQKCDHLQLDTEISMHRLFKHYVYTSNTSSGNYNYLHNYAKQMVEQFHPSFVIDIGGNDGTFLHFFQDFGCQILNVDPAENIAEIARNNGVPTDCCFFNELVSVDIKSHHGQSDLITCNNMFAHNRNLDEILLGVKNLLSDSGTFVFEVSYAMKLLENKLFDLIYHEHFHHWHLTPAIKYFNKFGLSIYDAEIIEQTHGGSIRVYVQHSNVFTNTSSRLKDLLIYEDTNFDALVNNFRSNVEDIKTQLVNVLHNINAQSKRIAILGYPAKACTLSYYFDLNDYIIKNIYDDNPLKIGKYSHKGILIDHTSLIYKHKPDYLLLLSWNYKEEMVRRHKLFFQTGGKFIVPLPRLEII